MIIQMNVIASEKVIIPNGKNTVVVEFPEPITVQVKIKYKRIGRV